MSSPIAKEALDTLFLEARTYSAFLPKPVEDATLKAVYDLFKMGPTSANTSPVHVVFLKSQAAKERLKPALSPGNADKTMAAPVCAIVASDTKFYEHIPLLWPHNPEFKNLFTKPGQEKFAEIHAFRNATLQGAYLILAARAVGLDVGPMSGFDNGKVDAEFFADGRFKSNFLVNIGYGDGSKLKPRNPRLSFDQACEIV